MGEKNMTKKTKLMSIGLMSVAALGFFAACGNKSDSSESDGKDYSFYYLTDPETLDYTFSGQKYGSLSTVVGR